MKHGTTDSGNHYRDGGARLRLDRVYRAGGAAMIALAVVVSLLLSALVLTWCRAGALEDAAHERWLAELEAGSWKQE